MIDWDLAVRVGSRLVGEGPQVSRAEAVEAVEELRAGAERSTPLVREFTGLVASERTAPVLVVDRPGWIQANADGFATVIAPLVDKLQEKKGAPGPLAEAIGSRITGVELGAMLGFLGSKVLGQFDPFHDARRAGPAAAGGAQHRPRRARARRRPARLPALGLPARGDPPGAVHRRAVDDRPPALGDGLDHRRRPDRPRPSCSATRSRRSATWSPARPTAACSTCSPAPSRRRSSTGSPA